MFFWLKLGMFEQLAFVWCENPWFWYKLLAMVRLREPINVFRLIQKNTNCKQCEKNVSICNFKMCNEWHTRFEWFWIWSEQHMNSLPPSIARCTSNVDHFRLYEMSQNAGRCRQVYQTASWVSHCNEVKSIWLIWNLAIFFLGTLPDVSADSFHSQYALRYWSLPLTVFFSLNLLASILIRYSWKLNWKMIGAHFRRYVPSEWILVLFMPSSVVGIYFSFGVWVED